MTFTLLLALLLTPPPYDRAAFGSWVDADHDCQDTRSEVLHAAGTTRGDCHVWWIAFTDSYTGETYTGFAHLVDVDHLVPLREAWVSGAWGWAVEERRAFANDERGLVPTYRSVNRSKGARDPGSWLPPDRSAWCWYGRRWLEIKGRYRLAMDGAEVAGVARALAECGDGRSGGGKE